MKKIFLICIFILCFSVSVLACQFDTDCNVGSKCVKPKGSIYGVCKGGLFPGNDNDESPAEFFPDLDGTIGDTCSFDTDCGVGNKCVKEGGYIYGVCMPRK